MIKKRLSHNNRHLNTLIGVWAVTTILIGFSCDHTGKSDDRLDLAESLMETRPDSSLLILNGIEDSELSSVECKARYSLLKSMALDKNFVDTTTFDVLQPALDYYLNKGNEDERLRTYYYQGRIHENAGEDDLAMRSYLTALDDLGNISDSLTLARMLVAQATLFYKEYQMDQVVGNNLKAAEIYGSVGRKSQQSRCLLRALQGEIALNNQPGADSILSLYSAIIEESSSMKNEMLRTRLLYAVSFGDNKEIKSLTEEVQKAGIADDIPMNLARAYSKICQPETGLRYIEKVKIASDDVLDSLTYWSVKTGILENLGNAEEALESYRKYSRLLEEHHMRLFSNELLFAEKKHEIEIENMTKIQKRDNLIKWILIGATVLMFISGLLYYRYRMNKARRLIAERNAEKLRLEATNLGLETEKLRLEADYLKLEVRQLDIERERLEGLLESQDTHLSEEARLLIRERIDMLNGLFAQALTEEDSYGKEFRKYVDKIKKNKKRFQESIGKVLEGTHPEFMAYLKEHGLTEREIDYVCLYAIGLRGKEIGNYLGVASHYNISSDIRRKLGLDSNGENLGPFLRNMMEGKGQSKE